MRAAYAIILACALLASAATVLDFAPVITGLAVHEESFAQGGVRLASIEKSVIDSRLSQEIRPGNEPYFIDMGNSTAVLAIHGLTASPWEMQGLAEYLAERNISVYAPLIAGHGTSQEDLAKTSWQDWYYSAESALLLLENYSGNVYIAGMSAGADIAILLAKEHPRVNGVILISPALIMRDWKFKYAWLLKHFVKYVKTSSLTEEETQYYYEAKPVSSVHQLAKLAKKAKSALRDVSTPVLVIQSLRDPTVDPDRDRKSVV